jgi:murein DD-endopeptidase MepM/ murein hydrolase activator NlpD
MPEHDQCHRSAGGVVRVLRLCTGLLLVGPLLGAAEAPRPPASAAVVPAVAPAAPVAPAGPFRWPLDGVPRVVRPFAPPPEPWLPGHRGVDLAAPPGATVRAAGAGWVRFAGQLAGRGVISIEHAGGLRTTYEPVTVTARVGDRVAAGEPIGQLVTGHLGCPAVACLHWGLRRGEAYLDPSMLLGFGQVRLLPRYS